MPDDDHPWSLDSKKRDTKERGDQPRCSRCDACGEARAGLDVTPGKCDNPEHPDCLFKPQELPQVQPGTLEQFDKMSWTRGINIRYARGRRWFLLLEMAGADRVRLQEIAKARGFRRGWVEHAIAEAQRNERRRGIAA